MSGRSGPAVERAASAVDHPTSGIPTHEGLRALERVLGNPHLAHVLVTPRAIPPRSTAPTLRPPLPQGAADSTPDPDDIPSRIAGIWAHMLGLPQVAARDNLFELGADSLTIVQIANEMSRAGLPVSPGDIFAHPTPGALAARLTAPDPAPATAPDPAPGTTPDTPTPSEAATPDPDPFPDADLSTEDLAQVMNLFRSGEDTQ
ncbi:hypothetical protein GTY41_38800 [Streptomyces sp. SID685]|nr:hypothetical protein [Streptomyces sp. SID685]